MTCSSPKLRTFTGKLGKRLLITIDWTEWHPPLRMLTAAVVVGTRAVPIHVAAFTRSWMPRSQSSRENAFAETLAMFLREVGKKTVVLADRGFRRVSSLQVLQRLRLSFVVRLKDDFAVHVGGEVVTLAALGLKRGQVRHLGHVDLRQDGAVQVRVVGVWNPKAREPWWLATDHDASASELASLYDHRMCVEEQFRDVKGCRC